MSTAFVIAQSKVAMRDPQDCTDQAEDLALLEAMFDALVRRGPDGRYRPALAESWDISDDARTWTFRLRPGLTFHDGRPLDAEAAAWSIRRMQRPDVGATLGAPAVWGQYLGGAEITATDGRTVRVTTTEPTADLLDILASGYVLPPDLADTPGFLSAPIGSGAYKVDEISPGQIAMSANPGWHGGTVRHERLLWREVPDAADRAASVAAGEADVATRLAPSDADAVPHLVPHVDPVAIIFILNAAKGPFADARVRLAASLAIDRQAIIDDVLGGAGVPLLGFVSGNHWGAAPNPSDPFDRAEARRLLADAGHGDGLEILVDRPVTLPDEAEPLTNAVLRQLAEIGVAANVRVTEDRTAYAEAVRDKHIGDMCLFDSSPMSVFRVIAEKADSRQKGSWWEGYANPKVEALLDQARRTPDEAAREAVYRDAYAAMRADPPWLTLYNRRRAVAFKTPPPAGWRMRPDGVLDVTAL